MAEDQQHIEIADHGTIVVLRPISDEARAWFTEHVGEPDRGGVYYCDHRPAQHILDAAANELLS